MPRPEKTLEDRIVELERTVVLLRDHQHNGQGRVVVDLWEAEDAVDSALHEANKLKKKEETTSAPRKATGSVHLMPCKDATAD